MIEESFLVDKYVIKKMSVREIATILDCSENKVNYWLQKFQIKKRTISEAVYQKNNPDGDPFQNKDFSSKADWFLYGLGLGLYWGEGTKANKNSVRLGNTDPDLILSFLKFLEEIYKIDKNKLKFGLQIFSDCPQDKALKYWTSKLRVPASAFYKVVVTQSGKIGNYRHKNQYGVLTVYFSNTKLRDMIVGAIDELRTTK